MKGSYAIALCTVALGLGNLLAGDQADPRLAKVLADWQRRQNWCQTVEYEARGNITMLKGAYSDAFPGGIAMGIKPGQVLPPQDVTGPIGLTLLLDFTAGRHRRVDEEQILQSETGKFKLLVQRDVFAGGAYTGLVEMPAPQIVTMLTGNMANAEFANSTHPIFFGHGRIRTVKEPILPGQLRNQPDPTYLSIHGADNLDGRQCLIVRTKTLVMGTTSFEEYWVDPDRDSAIVRYRSFSGDHPTQDLTIDYTQTEGRWLPQGWHLTFLRRGKTLQQQDLKVVRVTVNPPVANADFALPLNVPGMLVRERIDQPSGNVAGKPPASISVYEVQADGSRKPAPDPFRSPADQFRRGPGGGPQRNGGGG